LMALLCHGVSPAENLSAGDVDLMKACCADGQGCVKPLPV
jgi:hypothetical protein